MELHVDDAHIPRLNKFLIAMKESLEVSAIMLQIKPDDLEVKKIHVQTLIRKAKIERIIESRIWEKIF